MLAIARAADGTGRVVRSLLAILSGKLVVTAGNLLLLPLYLAYWSPTRYGEWLTLSATVAYLSLLDLGMNMGAVNRLTQAHARGDLEEYRSIQRAAMTFYVGAASMGTLVMAGVAVLAPWRATLGFTELGGGEVAGATWLLSCLIVWAMPSGLLVAIYRSTGDLATSQWIGNAQQTIAFVGTAVALLVGLGPVSIAAVQLAALAIVTGGAAVHLRRRAPAPFPSFGRWPRGTLPSLLRPSLLFVLVLAANALSLQGSVIVVSLALGGAAVTMFVTLRTLANVIRQVVNVLVIAVWPEVTRLETEGARPALRSAHALVTAATTAICIAFAAALWWEGAGVVASWTRGVLAPDVTTLRILLVLLVLQSPWVVSFGFVGASNRHGPTAVACLAASVIGVATAAVLVRRWGIAGVAAGLVVGDVLACSHFVVRESCRLVGEPYEAFARRLWSRLVLVAALALLAGWLSHVGVGGPALVRWCATGVATTAATALATWMLWLTPDGRRAVSERLGPLLTSAAGAKA